VSATWLIFGCLLAESWLIVVYLLLQGKALGRILFEQVCNTLNLLEADYFGLEYTDMNGAKVSYPLFDSRPN